MSKPFESELADWVLEEFANQGIVEGDRFRAQFPDRETADAFAEELYSKADHYTTTLEFEEETEDIVTFDIADVPVHFVRVHPSGDDVTKPYEASRWYGSTLRTLLSIDDDLNGALFLVIEEGVKIETLDATQKLFTSPDLVPLTEFKQHVFEDYSGISNAGKAVLDVLQDLIIMPSDDTGLLHNLAPLRRYCSARVACKNNDGQALASMPPQLERVTATSRGPFMREDLFEDDWFGRSGEVSDLQSQVEQILKKNEEMAEMIDNCLGATRDERAELSAHFSESFVEDILESSDWKAEISRMDAKNRLLGDEEGDGGTESSGRDTTKQLTGDSGSGSGSSVDSSKPPTFESVSIEAEAYQVFPEKDEDEDIDWRHIIAKTTGEVDISLSFSASVEDEPIRFHTPDDDDSTDYILDDDTIRIEENGLDPEVPHFFRLDVYLGHKQRSGTPSCRVALATVPEWFFDSLEDDIYHVNQEIESLEVPTGSPVTLWPPSAGEDAREFIKDIQSPDEEVILSQPLFIRPKPDAIVDRLTALITTEDAKAPVNLSFAFGHETTETAEVQFPLSLETIINPDDWDSENLIRGKSVVINTTQGRITSSAREPFEIPSEDKSLIELEEAIRKDKSVAPRQINSTELDGSSTGQAQTEVLTDLPSSIENAYDELFEHFKERDTTPSTDRWDKDTCNVVEDVLSAFLDGYENLDQGASALEYGSYRRLGTVESTVADKVWLTAYHPLMLAYGLQLVEWREHLVETDHIEGFHSERFEKLFSPAGLAPFRWSEGREDILSGQIVASNHLWVAYSTPEGYGTETPKYMDEEISQKLEAFYRAFPALFEIHPEREITINLVSIGDLKKVVEGLFDFYSLTEGYSEVEPPKITLRIYGGPTEGRALDELFATDTDSSITKELRKKGSDGAEIVDIMQDRITYIHEPKGYLEDPKPAHITFFRGLLDERTGTFDTDTESEGLRFNGLLPRESLEVKSVDEGTESKSGIILPSDSSYITGEIGHAVNAMEAGYPYAGLDHDKSLCRVVKFGEQGLSTTWQESLWVSHIDPQVGLDFYIQTSTNGADADDAEGALMIHYSDQYDSTPGFDVITLTDKRDPYLRALQRELEATPGLDTVDPDSVLTRLVAIDGELALDIQRAEGNSVTELLGFVGGLAVGSYLLERDLPGYEWIPLSLNEYTRHDRQYRRHGEPLLPYPETGKATDDLCFVGIPSDPPEGRPELKIRLIETKGGTASIPGGATQIQNGKENLEALFKPEKKYADTHIRYSEFGVVISKIAERLHHYDVIDDDQIAAVNANDEALYNGGYDVSFLMNGADGIGDVIRIQSDIAIPEPGFNEDVRTMRLPLEALSLINANDETEVPELIRELDVSFTTDPNAESDQPEDRDDVRVGRAEPEDEDVAADEPDVESDASPTTEESDQKPDEQVADAAEQPTEAAHEPGEEAAATEENTVEEAHEPDGDLDSGASGSQPPNDSEDEAASDDRPTASFPPELAAVLEELSRSDPPSADFDAGALVSSIKEEFESMGVHVHRPNPANVSVGPRKIGVSVHPKEGQKIGGILNNLDSVSVHIQASGTITGVPVPSEGAVRLEIPHGNNYSVPIASAFDAKGETLCTPLNIPLGVSTEMEHVSIDLLDEHHLLIGGATGSGKSNFLSTIIASLAMGNRPTDVQMSILDPKALDFGKFEPLPHVGEYIDSADEAVDFLTSLLDTEVEERRSTLQEAGHSSVRDYNELAREDGRETLPYRVIVIDEYADLTMAVDDSQKLETAVTRLAQIGRALGYSILLATQRPDAEVVSGKIKTNFQSRVAFELPTGTDSRVILDQNGAEDLQGEGDMIAITRNGTEHHLQAYYLPLTDATAIVELLSE